MDSPRFNIPDVSSLREGIDYTVVGWDFAAGTPTSPPTPPHTPGESCGPNQKMVFGICRQLRSASRDEKDFDSSKKTKQEEELEGAVKAQGKVPTTKEEAVAANAKGFTAGGKKYGWAMKDGKPVMVEWGSVAGTKKKEPAATTPAPGAAPASTPGPSSPAPAAPAAGAPAARTTLV